MPRNEENQSENSQEQNGQQLISLETILSDLPGRPNESEYHTESVDPENIINKGEKLED
jgi:hypothetical protein